MNVFRDIGNGGFVQNIRANVTNVSIAPLSDFTPPHPYPGAALLLAIEASCKQYKGLHIYKTNADE